MNKLEDKNKHETAISHLVFIAILVFYVHS